MYGTETQTKLELKTSTEILAPRKHHIERELGHLSLEDYLKSCNETGDIVVENAPITPESNKQAKTELVEPNSRNMIDVSAGKEKNIVTTDLSGDTAVAVLMKSKNKSRVYIQNYSPKKDLKSTQTLAELLQADMPRGSVVERVVILTPEGKNQDINGKQLPKNELLTNYLKTIVEQNQGDDTNIDVQVSTYKEKREITDDGATLRGECLSDGTINVFVGSKIVQPTSAS